jgi:hypothetical protein
MTFERKPHGKLILNLDFDGVMHSYSSGWQGADNIPDPPVPGLFEWIAKALPHFEVHVFSARSKEEAGRKAMYEWVKHYAGVEIADQLTFTAEKGAMFIGIDDRVIQFHGDWSDPQFEPEKLLAFTPWYKLVI